MVRLLPDRCVRRPSEKSRFFFFQTIVDFVLILIGYALGLDHDAALQIFRANVLKHAKTEGVFQQSELRKTDTTREVCGKGSSNRRAFSSPVSIFSIDRRRSISQLPLQSHSSLGRSWALRYYQESLKNTSLP